jgi:drug/metabolite transporter (DMT)-like permease
MNFFARLASASASWATVAATRALVGALVAGVVARSRGHSLVGRNHRLILIRSALGTVSMVLSFQALSSHTVSLGDTVTLLNLSPIFVAILAPFALRERTSSATWLALALSLIGVFFVVHPATRDLPPTSGPSAVMTVAMAVAAACASSMAMIMLRKVGDTEHPETVAFQFSMLAAVTTGLFACFDARVPSSRDVVFMVLAGLSAGVAQILMTRAYALEQAARVGSLSPISVVASAALGALALGERPTALAVAGTGLVIAGGTLVTLRAASVRRRPEA